MLGQPLLIVYVFLHIVVLDKFPVDPKAVWSLSIDNSIINFDTQRRKCKGSSILTDNFEGIRHGMVVME